MASMKRIVAAVAALMCLGIAFVAFGQGSAGAYSTPPGCGVSATSVSAGSTDTLSGNCGATAGGEVDVYIHSTSTFLGSTVANSAGDWSVTVTIPACYSGSHTLSAIDKDSGKTLLEVPITVSASSSCTSGGGGGGLADTGVAVVGLSAIGAVLLAGGALMLLAGRRRKSTI